MWNYSRFSFTETTKKKSMKNLPRHISTLSPILATFFVVKSSRNRQLEKSNSFHVSLACEKVFSRLLTVTVDSSRNFAVWFMRQKCFHYQSSSKGKTRKLFTITREGCLWTENFTHFFYRSWAAEVTSCVAFILVV